jgi:DNA segregation ATPase FtsK/SpoIIIE-like protein
MILIILLITTTDKKSVFFIPANLISIGIGSCAIAQLWSMQKHYEDQERIQDTLRILKETQTEEQLTYLETAAETRRVAENADKDMERQLKTLEATAPFFTGLLDLTGKNGVLGRMALGMLQKGESLGDVLLATADAEMRLEQARIDAQLQQKQLEVQQVANQNQPTQTVTAQATEVKDAPPPPQSSNIALLQKAAAVVGLQSECLRVDKAPSYERLVFSVRTQDYKLAPKWKQAAKLALGEKNDLPMYVCGSEQIAVELALPQSQRTFYDFPIRQWVQGDRTIVLGKSLDGEASINLASEDTPQLLVVGTTGSGKSNFLRAAAYCLLMQGAKVDICGGKVSDYEDFPVRFPSISVHDMNKTFEYVSEYFAECDRRNSMGREELAKQPAWALLIDEYKGTVPFEEKLRKIYDQQLCEVARRGRGLKIHLIVGLQRGSKRTKDDPQALPPDLRDNLPCRIAFRCVDATSGRMVLHRRGEVVTSLQGRGDGVVQSGLLDTRFQAYRFERIP